MRLSEFMKLLDKSKEVFSQFYDNFDILFNEQSVELTDEFLKAYSLGWKKSSLFKNESNSSLREKLSYSTGAAEEKAKYKTILIKPYGAQIEALYYLELARSEVSKGLVVMATGERVIIVIGCSFYYKIKGFRNFKQIYFVHCLE